MGRNAKRAGMTLDQWILYCRENGNRDPMKMDRSIPNHSRGERAPRGSEKDIDFRERMRTLAEVRARDTQGNFSSRYEASKGSAGVSHSRDSSPVEAVKGPRGEVKPTGGTTKKGPVRSGAREAIGTYTIKEGDSSGRVGRKVRIYRDEKGDYIELPRPAGSKVKTLRKRKYLKRSRG
jgi:hypothetical protein